MTAHNSTVIDFLTGIPPFNRFDSVLIERIASKLQPLRYRMGQAIVSQESLPARVVIIYEGQARLLVNSPGTNSPDTLQILKPGEILGWVSLIRGVSCETAIASCETLCLTLSAEEFWELLKNEPVVGEFFDNCCTLIEVFNLLGAELERQGENLEQLQEFAMTAVKSAKVQNLPRGKTKLSQLDQNLLWLVSSDGSNFDVGTCLNSVMTDNNSYIEASKNIRLIGLNYSSLPLFLSPAIPSSLPLVSIWDNAPYAPEKPEIIPAYSQNTIKYPFISGRGNVDATLACLQMICEHLQVPSRRDVLRRTLVNSIERNGGASLQLCGALAELTGLSSQLVKIPTVAISKLPTPALIPWEDSYAILYQATEKELILGIPEQGIRRKKTKDFAETWGEEAQVLLLQATKETPKHRFGLHWFVPALKKHYFALIEVFLASLFVQVLGLANPVITQLIIDKVLVHKGGNTLSVLGVLLIAIAITEAVVTWLRTNLFVDTTNRIDLALGSEVIDHLLRLPLRYFERRPVGELASRINELENIRSFLTGKALTVVLDAIFSFIYVGVMLFYSWTLTLVALSTVPLFALLTFIFAPIIRKQTRTKAENNSETQSYLVEVVSGIQTVKAQNIELNSRYEWQRRYGRYISASFRNVLISSTASSISTFLNKLSSLLLLWVGAYLVLQDQLTLGQLIAFRIIAGYTTSPLLRLIQLWQNFQETALSLERLGDILDSPQESEITGRDNITMPEVQGKIRYENLTFRFEKSPTPQLDNVCVEISAGSFVGVVGQSGAGKSTLTKLLPRLYEPDSGRIFIDNYDISKVELYSLRRQIGMVLQDTLLFDGTVRENIALTLPDASSEEIIEAAKIACAHDFIMSLPQGYNSRVGQRGSGLSGGQRQRIAIARTILQNPPLLILDEATSALDYDTERQVCLNLARALQGKTVLFITHRLATIQNADTILMMSQGRVAEQGTHQELMALKGLYFCLYQQQKMGVNS
ncbi:peptidase domain-containing ABC transporter [Calothrix sp. 336/3]|uniref:peptidase domain-containing ABC transporter n=1 Tax=Calothrix sp. 336/3 TaxID=1337936 RepID=UPI0004E4180D|nr:peptidase domain-containing ABC transporter [Calothrix sp. 336/3]AKG21028.1 peptidase C39 [Calothrix sp. 336/3]